VKRFFAVASITVCAVALGQSTDKPSARSGCLTPAAWHTLTAGKPQVAASPAVIAEMAKRDVVLLGEQHDNPDHHQWQVQTVSALHSARPITAIGFESFPRRLQPVLDQWVNGELSPRQFLERTEWEKVWSFPPELYMPLFEFARVNRIPMIALNVERTLTRAVGEKGWDSVPESQREGVGRPAPASPAYEDMLFDVFGQHGPTDGKENTRANRKDPAFRNFVESQLTWDRAMAEALATRVTAKDATRPLVVGIMGGGHVRDGYGVPYQLRDVGITKLGVLLPVEAGTDCEELKQDVADAVFALPAHVREKPAPPRLGVRLEMADGGVRVASVSSGSLAETSGLRVGDQIVTVAGIAANLTNVIAAVRTQPAGTWLPLQIRRAEDTVELIIKFPAKT